MCNIFTCMHAFDSYGGLLTSTLAIDRAASAFAFLIRSSWGFCRKPHDKRNTGQFILCGLIQQTEALL